MGKKTSGEKTKYELASKSKQLSTDFKVGNSVEKLARFSDDFGKIGIIKLQEISKGDYYFCWVDWGNGLLKPEHYDCIRRVEK